MASRSYRAAIVHRLRIINPQGKKLSAILTKPAGRGSFPLIIVAQGLGSTKEGSGKGRFVTRALRLGFAVCHFDYTGHGESGGTFFRFTPTQAIADLKTVYEFVVRRKDVDRNRIGVSGASLGGLAALYLAATRVIKALVLIAPAVDYPGSRLKHWGRKVITDWKKKGWIVYYNGERLGYSFHLDSKKRIGYFIARQIRVPVLVIHGDKDINIPIEFSRRLMRNLHTVKKFIVFRRIGHVFSQDEVTKRLNRYTLNWFEKYIKK